MAVSALRDLPTPVPGVIWDVQQEAEAEQELEGEEERPCLSPEPTGACLGWGLTRKGSQRDVEHSLVGKAPHALVRCDNPHMET